MTLTGKFKMLGEKPFLLEPRPPQILHTQIWDRPRTPTIETRRLTARDMIR